MSYGKATPYFPVVDLLKRYVHVEDGDDLRTVRAKVAGHILTLDESLQETIPTLLSLLDALPDDSPQRPGTDYECRAAGSSQMRSPSG